MDIIKKIAAEFKVKTEQVENTVGLIDEGNTIPFIARYRKEVTGGLSDVILRDMDERLKYLRGLEERKEEVIRLIDEQGKLTPDLQEQIEKAEVLQRVEDLYKPFKQKKATRASKAREKGLEPLAMLIYAQLKTEGTPEEEAEAFVDPEKDVNTAEEALAGAMDIIAEMIADDPDMTEAVRNLTYQTGLISTEAVDPEEKTVYDMYYGKTEAISKIPNHRVLAVNRGEKEKKLKVKVTADQESIHQIIAGEVIKNHKSIFTEILNDTITDAYKRLIAPSVGEGDAQPFDRESRRRGHKDFREKYGESPDGSPCKRQERAQHRPGLQDRLQGGCFGRHRQAQGLHHHISDSAEKRYKGDRSHP